MDPRKLLIAIVLVITSISLTGQSLEQSFRTPPDSVKPWVVWFWINGNISHEGITKDLEALKEVGINGLYWRR